MSWLDDVYKSIDDAHDDPNRLKRKKKRNKKLLRCIKCGGVFVVPLDHPPQLCNNCLQDPVDESK